MTLQARPEIRSARRTSYPPLMVFLIAYLAALAIVLGPQDWLRTHPVIQTDTDGGSGLIPAQ